VHIAGYALWLPVDATVVMCGAELLRPECA
jgi:hypothetical protein